MTKNAITYWASRDSKRSEIVKIWSQKPIRQTDIDEDYSYTGKNFECLIGTIPYGMFSRNIVEDVNFLHIGHCKRIQTANLVDSIMDFLKLANRQETETSVRNETKTDSKEIWATCDTKDNIVYLWSSEPKNVSKSAIKQIWNHLQGERFLATVPKEIFVRALMYKIDDVGFKLRIQEADYQTLLNAHHSVKLAEAVRPTVQQVPLSKLYPWE